MTEWVCDECKTNHTPMATGNSRLPKLKGGDVRSRFPVPQQNYRHDWSVFKRGELRGKRVPVEYFGRMKEAYAAGWSMGHLRNQQEFAFAGLAAVLNKFEEGDIQFKATNKHIFEEELSQYRLGQKSVLDWLERWARR